MKLTASFQLNFRHEGSSIQYTVYCIKHAPAIIVAAASWVYTFASPFIY